MNEEKNTREDSTNNELLKIKENESRYENARLLYVEFNNSGKDKFYLNREHFMNALKEKKLKKAELCRMIHKDKSIATRWIAEEQQPISFEDLYQVSKILNKPIPYLLGDTKIDMEGIYNRIIGDMRLARQNVYNLLLEQGIEVLEEQTDKNDGLSDFPVPQYYIRFSSGDALPITEKQLEFLCNQAKKAVACLFDSYRENYTACFI